MATLQELISRVREYVQDPAGVRWSDSVITQFLNDGQMDIAPFARYTKTAVISVTGGSSSVPAPADLFSPVDVVFEDYMGYQWRLEWRRGVLPFAGCSGVPKYCFVAGSTLALSPLPASDGKLILVYVPRPVPMTNPDDSPTYPVSDGVLVDYAVWRCFRSDGDPQAPEALAVYERSRREWAWAQALAYPSSGTIVRTDEEW